MKQDTEIQVRAVNDPLQKFAMIHEVIKLSMRAQMAKDLTHMLVATQSSAVAMGHRENVDPVKTIITMACDLAQEAFTQFEERGWLINVPSLTELSGDVDRQKTGF